MLGSAERVFENLVARLVDDLENEFVSKLQPLIKFVWRDHRKFNLSPKEVLRKKESKVFSIYVTNDEDIDEIVG